MSKATWEVIASVTDVPSARALVGLLQSERVPADIRTETVLLGEMRNCDVVVPSELVHRARWVLAQAHFSDAELTYMATGEFEGLGEEEPKQ